MLWIRADLLIVIQERFRDYSVSSLLRERNFHTSTLKTPCVTIASITWRFCEPILSRTQGWGGSSQGPWNRRRVGEVARQRNRRRVGVLRFLEPENIILNPFSSKHQLWQLVPKMEIAHFKACGPVRSIYKQPTVYGTIQDQIEHTGLGLRIDAFCGWRHLVILPPYHNAAKSDPPSYAIFIPRPLF